MATMSEEEFRRRLLKPLDDIRKNSNNYLDNFQLKDSNKERAHVSLRGYVDNPSGSGTAYLASRKLIKQSLKIGRAHV